MKYEYIEETEVEVVKRGRKSSVPTEVVDAIRNIPAGKTVKFTELALDPTDADYKNGKASVSAMLRQAGKMAGTEVSVRFTPAGIPQVTPKTKKSKTAKK
jgi:hypothetical protein